MCEREREEQAAVLFNIEYGGFRFSQFIIDEYKLKTGDDIDELQHETYRSDPVIIDLYKEFGSDKCSGPYCALGIQYFPKRLVDSDDILVKECDGRENLYVEYYYKRYPTIIKHIVNQFETLEPSKFIEFMKDVKKECDEIDNFNIKYGYDNDTYTSRRDTEEFNIKYK